MIGNDIVDLEYSSRFSDWKRPGFLEKLFTKEEQMLILNTVNQEDLVWRLWSMKESAYKAEFRNTKKRIFNPVKYQCSLINKSQGFVNFDGCLFHCQSLTTKSAIHSIAWLDGLDTAMLRPSIKEFKKPVSSVALYQCLKDLMAPLLEVDVEDLILRKTPFGIPEVFHRNSRIEALCSLSHHGQFGGLLIYA